MVNDDLIPLKYMLRVLLDIKITTLVKADLSYFTIVNTIFTHICKHYCQLTYEGNEH